MGLNKWFEGEHGTYGEVRERAAGEQGGVLGAGAGAFQGAVRTLKLSTALRQARRKRGVIAGDPEKALAQRQRRSEKPLTFDALVKTMANEFTTRT